MNAPLRTTVGAGLLLAAALLGTAGCSRHLGASAGQAVAPTVSSAPVSGSASAPAATPAPVTQTPVPAAPAPAAPAGGTRPGSTSGASNAAATAALGTAIDQAGTAAADSGKDLSASAGNAEGDPTQ